MKKLLLLTMLLLMAISSSIIAQNKDKKDKDKEPLDEISIPGLKFRNIGPAITSGRISDFAVHPDNNFTYYVATSSGGVWKTDNWGVTYKPVFDGQGSYSIGCVTIDPNNPSTVWVGTGENNNQRSVAYGDGIYKSEDGGASWKQMGLKNSEHIGKIIVHPENSNVVYVAAIGPLWSAGGDRGVYKTTDGGKTWNAVFSVDEHTGVNDIVMDPQDSDIIYASAFQRRRHVYTYVGGGPGSGLHKTTDGGQTWTQINKGLPSVELGRIGLSISPADPEIIYAIVEAAEGKGGLYRTTNKGAKWTKQGSYSTSGNYYQEIIADPVDANTLYAMDTWMKVSHDGGKTFKNVGEDFKHVDNHAMWINPNNTDHWLVGCDGGIYETWDAARTWDFKENLPVTQFYKVALDNDEPFYHVYGGTQDNFSLGGPSRTITSHGITNYDWFITHGGDGFESQVDPFNPDIVYAQSQYGVLVRYDRKSGEEVGIQPKERKGENEYVWNWDAPLAVSPHAPGRLYSCANKVFRSDDYGNSWSVLSEDLSRNLDRNTLKVYGRVLGMDAVAKNGGTSPYGAIVSFAESALDENLLIAGTDDGLIQITEDGGNTWRMIDHLKGAPSQSYVNSVYLSQHDPNVIYVAFNHHKYGDFKPYIFKSSDRGNSWNMISNNLPERGSVYAIEEDHVDRDLIFCGTEFGVFFSPNGGKRWKQLKAGVPTIAVRDLAIQRRENDLVLGTFGRGFFVLDDYSALRSVENQKMEKDAELFAVRPALMWEKSNPFGLPGKAFQGDNFYTAENLGPEALITYMYNKDQKSLKDQRKKSDKEAAKEGKDTRYPTYEELKAENDELLTQLIFTISDKNGKVLKKITEKPGKGIKRIKWDLRYNSPEPVNLSKPSFYNPFAGANEGTLVEPGTYAVNMHLYKDGVTTHIAGPQSIEVIPLNNTVMPAQDRDAKVAFQREVAELSAELSEAQRMMGEVNNKIRYIKEAIKLAESPLGNMMQKVVEIERKMDDISTNLYGDSDKRKLDIEQPATPGGRIGWIVYEQKYSTSAPTKTHLDSYKIAKEEFIPIMSKLMEIVKTDVPALEFMLESAGAPYTPGRVIRTKN